MQGAVVTIDAMGCQCAIAEQTVSQGKEPALSLPKGKHSMRASRHVAAWNEDFLYSLLTE